MKIDYAVMSCDDSHFLDYWPVVAKAWERIGIDPILFFVGERRDWPVLDTRIRFLPVIPLVKTSLQGKIARLWAYKILVGNCIMSDIDMMPLSREYFHGMAGFNESRIVSYCADAAEHFDTYHPMCYVLANSKVMSSLIKQPTWEEFVREVVIRGGQESGNADQWWLTNLLNSYDNVVSLNRGWNSAGCALNRLDREHWQYDPDDVRSGRLYDAHLPRPYANFKKEIEDLLALVQP
jgi:hypothetical protein